MKLRSISLLGSVMALALAFASTPFAAENTVDFEVTDLNGKPQKLSAARGKWVVLNFWATWCPPCLEEMPLLSKFHDKHSTRDAVVWGINYEDISVSELTEFVGELHVTYPIYQGGEELEKILEPLGGLPTTFLINPLGQLVASIEGPITPESIEIFIDQYESTSP